MTAVQKEPRRRGGWDVDESGRMQRARDGVGWDLVQTGEQRETDHFANLMQHETLPPHTYSEILRGGVRQLHGVQIAGTVHDETARLTSGRNAVVHADGEVVKVMRALILAKSVVEGENGCALQSGCG